MLFNIVANDMFNCILKYYNIFNVKIFQTYGSERLRRHPHDKKVLNPILHLIISVEVTYQF